jgi:tripartite-type tricarboxylate transporter receptor subunit TctC
MGVNVTHVPYRSGAQAIQDLVAGRVDYECPSAPVALPQIEGKTVKALAILSRNRSPSMPDLPSAHEQGLTDFDVPSWYALFLPKATPSDIVSKLNRATVAVLRSPVAQQRLKVIGSGLVAPDRMTPDYLARFVAAEIDKWAVVIQESGISLERWFSGAETSVVILKIVA